MNKAELVAALAAKTDSSKKSAESFVNALIGVTKQELKKSGSIQLVGFGTFKVAKREARKGRNPRTGEVINIPATKFPKFVPGKALKEAVK